MRILQQVVLVVGLICSCFTFASALRAPGPHTERVHHTQIKATIDTEKHRVEATMQLRWRNTTGQTLNEIPFHMYLNAFSSTDSVFMMESNGGQLRGDKRDGDNRENFGYIRVTAITDAQGDDLSSMWSMDKDIAQLQLPQPLAPNEEITLNINFISQLPKVFARSGHNGDTFNFVAQWFPKPGVFKDGEWVNHRYHAHSEFFADFGNYDVELTAPSTYVVGATGYLANKTVTEETTTHHYIAEDVHDFVWTADSEFGEAEIEWQGIKIRLLYQEGLDEKSIENQFEAAKASFTWFDEHVGPYPYSTMTLVQPPKNAGGAAGMEYPTLVTTITNLDYSEHMEFAALVTIHEIGHNYWQGIFASNEFEESWMDEGINSYTEGRIMSETMDRQYVAQFDHIRLKMPFTHQAGTARTAVSDPVKTKSWQYMSSRSYSTNSYSKPATILYTAERVWGQETIDRLLKLYYKNWAFKHPSTDDFLALAHQVNPEMALFLREAITTTKSIDLSVTQLRSEKSYSVGGYNLEDLDLDPASEPAFTETEEQETYANSVTVFREGELYPPSVNVLFTYANGETETRQWQFDTKVTWNRWQWQSSSQLVEVIIDPEFKLLLDKNLANNSKKEADQSKESWRWLVSLFQALQHSFSIILPI